MAKSHPFSSLLTELLIDPHNKWNHQQNPRKSIRNSTVIMSTTCWLHFRNWISLKSCATYQFHVSSPSFDDEIGSLWWFDGNTFTSFFSTTRCCSSDIFVLTAGERTSRKDIPRSFTFQRRAGQMRLLANAVTKGFVCMHLHFSTAWNFNLTITLTAQSLSS